MADQLPGLPEASLARARNHMVAVGRVLVANCDVVTVWLTVGLEKLSWSSIWIVYVAAPVTSVQSNVMFVPGAKRASAAGASNEGAGNVPPELGFTVKVALRLTEL